MMIHYEKVNYRKEEFFAFFSPSKKETAAEKGKRKCYVTKLKHINMYFTKALFYRRKSGSLSLQ